MDYFLPEGGSRGIILSLIFWLEGPVDTLPEDTELNIPENWYRV
jgi:hypothetical protein